MIYPLAIISFVLVFLAILLSKNKKELFPFFIQFLILLSLTLLIIPIFNFFNYPYGKIFQIYSSLTVLIIFFIRFSIYEIRLSKLNKKKRDKKYSYTLIILGLFLIFLEIISFGALYYNLQQEDYGCLTKDNQCIPLENKLDFFYYSGITFNTVGYGDLYPEGPLFKISSVIESLLGIITIFGFLVAGIVHYIEK